MVNPTDPVADIEWVYRRVVYDDCDLPTLLPTSKCFFDPGLQPSVDRAVLRNHQPQYTKKLATDGVATLSASAVRGIGEVVSDPIGSHNVDIRPDPIMGVEGKPDNPAHALIIAEPALPCIATGNQRDKAFRRLREALARIAVLVINPEPTK